VAAFNDWVVRYQNASATERPRLEAEGTALAKARLTVVADWVQTDPARVFDNSLSWETRRAMPASVQQELEQPVNGTGNLAVLATLPAPGETFAMPPVLRTATLDGQDYQVFTYGLGNTFTTRQGIPLYGLWVPNDAASVPFATPLGRPDRLLALSESPARWLGPDEEAGRTADRAAAGAADPLCGISGRPVTAQGTETAFEFGGNIHEFCGTEDAQKWLKAHTAGLGLDGSSASPLLSGDVAESSYTEGRKRMLLMRPIWSDYSTVMSTNEALTHWQNFSNYMFEMSYGKLVLAGIGKGSDITPPMLLPGGVADYDNTGLGALYENSKSTAQGAYGYDLTRYDFLYVCTGSRPAASYCGLAYVGGVGFHLANQCWDAAVSGHEFGHNLGLNHAHFWDTAAKSTIGDGQNVEYGDNSDPMGGGGSPNQYGSRYKNYLGWIHDTDIADLNARGSGTYRLYCFDLNEGSGLRGLKFRRNDSQNYWVQFRQRKTDHRALMNGVQLLWTGNGNEGSYLLDVRLKGTADDNAVIIGRTFTDPATGFHVTPVGKANTYPEAMDVVVEIGSFPANHDPVAILGASTLETDPGQLIDFNATASDADGDTLAYSWEFGDGDYSTDNRASTTHSYASPGEYVAQCTVSDMKGGTARHSLVVRIGAPTTRRITGHVLDNRNRPLSGVRVFADTTHFATTDSDGSYILANLPDGGYTLDALEPVSGSLSFAHPYFENPVTVGPSDATADFLGVPGSLIVKTAFISRKAAGWKYLDAASAPPAAWNTPGFDDHTWKTGAAILGYGQGGESTVIGYGPDANNKYPTAYFRKSFVVKNPMAYTNFNLEVLRDDGVAVYLNGKEVFRNNLPAGAPSYNTLAVDTVEPDSYLTATLPNTDLLTGTNWIAAEMHQATLNSSDLTFDLSISGLSYSNVAGVNLAFLSHPADNAAFAPSDTIPLAATVLSAATVSRVDFYADTTLLGGASAAPYTFDWNGPQAGPHLLRCVALIGTTLVTSPPVRITVTVPGTEPLHLDLVSSGDDWRYLARPTAAPAGWNKPGFDDSSWALGASKLGFGHGDEATVINGGPSSARFNTVYFRRPFTLVDPGSVSQLALRLKRDDGVALYLNGTEILRDNLPQGTLSYTTAATNAADNGAVFLGRRLPASATALLVAGTNWLAAEVHQSSTTSSDLAFDAVLAADSGPIRTRGCWVTAPAPASRIAQPAPLDLRAEAVAGDTLGIARVDFLIDGLQAGGTPTAPYHWTWQDPLPGSHEVVAVATDITGAAIPSSPVTFTVDPLPGRTALVNFGDAWSYLDDGSDAGIAWTATGFDDRTWSSGPAPLGYGGNGELTTIRQGTNATHRIITTWLRHRFVVTDPAAFSRLGLRMLRDDGAVVYLNGVEVLRDNLPTGPLSYNSLALAKVDGADETVPVVATLPASALVAGTNVVAVALHQQSPSNTDASFDLELTGLASPSPGAGVYVASPAAGSQYHPPATIPLSAEVDSDTLPLRVDYLANGSLVGSAVAFPYRASWQGAAQGTYDLVARAVYAGSSASSAPVRIQIGPPPPPIKPVLDRLIGAATAWRYWDAVTPADEGWNAAAFDDTAWKTGNGRLGFGLDGEATTLSAGRTTYYFRRSINVTNPAAYESLVFQLVRDDGAVVYLNGTEVYRSNMPDGPITPTTTALNVVNTPEETTYLETVVPVTGSGLLAGTNLVAVEVHQQIATSDDLAFDLQLLGVGTTEPRVTLTSPTTREPLPIGEDIRMQAAVQGTSPPSRVEFSADGAKVGEVRSAPWVLAWSDATLGAHLLSARAWYADGSSVDSAPLRVAVSPPLVSTQVVAADAVWRYLDMGVNLATAWRASAYNDSTWASGPARLGYGDDGEATTVSFGPDANAKRITTYFRTRFEIPADVVVTNLYLRLQRDDGAAVYVNGKEVFRSNLPANAGFSTLATAGVGGADEQAWFTTSVAVTNVIAGTNVVAAEVHQSAGNSSDLGFALEVIANGYLKSVPIVRPTLAVLPLANGDLEFSWPASATGFRLFAAPAVDTPRADWTPVSGTAAVAGDRQTLVATPQSGPQFYRLQIE
jgi:hypothetical protein